MADKDNDFSAFDEVMSRPDEDFSAFDEKIKEPGFLEKIYTSEIPFTPFVDPSLKDIVETGKSAAQKAQDFSVATARGLTAGAMDELGGGLSAGLETALSYLPGTSAYETRKVDEQLKAQGFEVPEESFWDKYRTYQQASEQAQKEAEQRSPGWSLAGQVVGGMTGGALAGSALGLGAGAGKLKSISDIARDSGKAKAALELLTRGATSYAKSTPLMAAEAALTSEKQLIGEQKDIPGVLSDVGSSLAFGVPAILGLEATSELAGPALRAAGEKLNVPIKAAGEKVDELIQKSPMLRGVKHSYDYYGKKLGISPRSEEAVKRGIEGVEGGIPFSQLNVARATDISEKILDQRSKLGQLTSEALNNENAKKIKINATDLQNKLKNKISELKKDMPYFENDRISNSILDNIKDRNYESISPKELKDNLDAVTAYIQKLSSYKIPSPEMEDTLTVLRNFRSELDSKLKSSVPDYRVAADRYYNFNRAYLEQPLAGRFDPKTNDLFYSDLKDGKLDLIQSFESLIKKTGPLTESGQDATSALSALFESTKNFEKQELQKLLNKQITPDQLVNIDAEYLYSKIGKAADDAAVRRSVLRTQETTSGGKLGAMEMLGLAPTGSGNLNILAAMAGRTVKKAQNVGQKIAQKPVVKGTADLAKEIYNAPAQSLSNVASRLESNGFESLGKALKESVESGNTYKKNAALFSIMQNPNARILIDEYDLSEQENVTDKTTEP